MSSTQKNFALPLAFIGIMFFAIGFALGINSVLIPVLQGSLGITSAESYLIIAATFVPFLIFGYPASMTIKAIGYIKDIAGAQNAYWICLPCFLFILYYGMAGYKIRTK
jgi:fucose permease